MLKLSFLNHILSLGEEDPVKRVYMQQLSFKYEPNWANECRSLREKYGIKGSDNQLKQMSKDEWKNIVREAVSKKALLRLNTDKNSKSKSSEYPDANELRCQSYFSELNREHACMLFRVRSRVLDVKEFRSFQYDEEDISCRVCGGCSETLSHVLSECPALSSEKCAAGDEYTDNVSKLESVAARAKEFVSKAAKCVTVVAGQGTVNEQGEVEEISAE